eukprot:6184544-Pleurochrysis_carterae.AAC.1
MIESFGGACGGHCCGVGWAGRVAARRRGPVPAAVRGAALNAEKTHGQEGGRRFSDSGFPFMRYATPYEEIGNDTHHTWSFICRVKRSVVTPEHGFCDGYLVLSPRSKTGLVYNGYSVYEYVNDRLKRGSIVVSQLSRYSSMLSLWFRGIALYLLFFLLMLINFYFSCIAILRSHLLCVWLSDQVDASPELHASVPLSTSQVKIKKSVQALTKECVVASTQSSKYLRNGMARRMAGLCFTAVCGLHVPARKSPIGDQHP